MQAELEDSLIVLDTVPEGYLRFDREFRFTFVNHAAERLLGTCRAELTGKRLCDMPRRSAVLEDVCSRALTEPGIVDSEDYFEPLQRWYAITAMPDAAGG